MRVSSGSAPSRSMTAVLFAFAAAALVAIPAAAHPPVSSSGDGTTTGSHTENPRQGLAEVGFHNLGNTGFNTDVWAWTSRRDGGLYATVGTWGSLVGDDPCPSETDNPLAPTKSGVKIVNATDPANPQLVARIATTPGSQNNDPKVERIEIRGGFKGDVLSHSREPCGAELVLFGLIPFLEDVQNPETGFQLYDVTKPSSPVKLGDHQNGGLGTHNHFIFSRPDLNRAFVAAVFNESPILFETRGELQIVEITNPNTPTLVSTWDLDDAAPQGGPTKDELCKERGTHLASCYLHDVWTNEAGTIAYLSYWDAGLVLVDITDPANPQFLGQIQSGTLEEEGNTHAAVPMTVDGRDVVVVGDEDFVGPGPLPHVTVNEAPAGQEVSAGEKFLGTEMTNTRPLSAGPVGPSPVLVADDEYGCAWGSAATVGNSTFGGNWIGIARRGGTCALFQQKVTAAEAAGADGLIIVNNGPGSSSGLAASTTMPAMMIPQAEGDRLIASTDPLNPGAVKVTMELITPAEVDPWGFMRVIDVSDPSFANWREVSQFRAPHVDTPEQPAQSVFSAHNPIPGPDGRIYFSWYTDGVRVLELANGGATVNETAWFVPLPSDHPDDLDSDPHGAQEDNVGFWGSMAVCHPTTLDLLVFNSDLNRGLYILNSTTDSCRTPDLTLSASDIVFSENKVQGGDVVTITATIHNIGRGPASDVHVRFTDNGAQIGDVQTIASIPAGGTGTASVVWSVKHETGTRVIEVTADPANTIRESDETNNTASKSVTVRGNKTR